MAKVTMPQLGESVAEGTIGKWLKQPGDKVAKYEPLLEVITDKVNAEVPSPFEGILKEILVEEGQTVPNNAEIAVIETEAGEAAQAGDAAPAGAPSAGVDGIAGETPAAPSEPEPAPPAQALPGARAEAGHGPAGSDERATQEMGRDGSRNGDSAAGAPAAGAPAGTAPAAAPAPTATAAAPAAGAAPSESGDGEARMTPAVRRLLREHGLSPTQIRGTGHGGRISRDDVLAFVEQQRTGGGQTQPEAAQQSAAPAPQAAGPAPSAPPAAQPADRAAQAQPTPAAPSPSPSAPSPAPVTPAPSWAPGQDEELVPLNQMRRGIANQMAKANAVPVAYSTFECDMTPVARLRDRVKDEYRSREGIGLSYLPFVVKAVVESLKRHPDINAHYTEAGLLRKRRINVGIAVAVDNGLIVPVIHDADQLSINGLNRAIQDLAGRARANKLRLDDLQGSSFTVDNTGWFGSVVSSPIINTPEVCILTTEAVVKRPVVKEIEDGDVLVIRSMMNLCAGFDHRATDGAQVGYFVRDVVRWLEAVTPELPIY